MVAEGIAGGSTIDGLLLPQPRCKTDARRQSDSDSHRAENQCDTLLFFSVATGCDVVSTASLVSSTTAESFFFFSHYGFLL
ncbi:hypothetical protein ACLK19_25600 [Escherichia coli]